MTAAAVATVATTGQSTRRPRRFVNVMTADVEALAAAGKLDRITPAQWVAREKRLSAKRFARRAAQLHVTIEEAKRQFQDEAKAHIIVGRDGRRRRSAQYALLTDPEA